MTKSEATQISALLAEVKSMREELATAKAALAAQPVREKDPFVLVFDTLQSSKSGKPYVIARLIEVASGEEKSFFVNGTFERDITGGTRIGHYLKPMTGDKAEPAAKPARPAPSTKPEVDADVPF